MNGQPEPGGVERKSPATRTRVLRVSIALASSALFGWLAVRSVPMRAMADSLQRASIPLIFVSLLAFLPALALRGDRWRLLADPTGESVDRSVAWRTMIVGLAANAVLPARAGDVGRILLLHRITGVPRLQAILATVVERVLDVTSLAALMIAVMWFQPAAALTHLLSAISLVVLLAFGILVAASGSLGSPGARLLRSVSGRLTGGSGGFEQTTESLRRGLLTLRRPRLLLVAILQSVGSWILICLADLAAIWSVDPGVPWLAAPIVLIATNFALSIPSAAGGIGVFEAAGVAALAAHGVAPAAALSAVLVVHAVNTVPTIVIGAGIAWRLRWTR